MKNIILIILLATTVASCWGQALKLGRDQALKDLKIIRKSVEEIHPGLNRFGQQVAFNSRFDSIAGGIQRQDSVSRIDFFRLVNPLMVTIKCGHVKFLPPFKEFPFYFHADKVLPIIVRFDEDDNLLIVKAARENLRGKFIQEINGKSVSGIIETLRRNMFVDGKGKTSADAQIQQYFSAWYADFIQTLESSFRIKVTDQSGNTEMLDLPPISAAAWKELDKEVVVHGKKNELTFLNESTALLRVASFMPEHSNRDFSKFLKTSFNEFSSKQIKHLIIDVRGNEGGNDKLGKQLYSYIAVDKFRYYDRIELHVRKKKDVTYRQFAYFPKFSGIASILVRRRKDGGYLWTHHKNLGIQRPRKNAYKENVSFLVDGLSFSVTSEFLSVAKSENRGKFIGEESGGGYSGDNSGTFIILKLPASGYDIGIPVAAYYAAVKPSNEESRGVLPHVEIRQTAADLLENRDKVLEYALTNQTAER
ncbi:S41 family peptidase [Dyadobacter sp. CY345]|uniref:S41 family peptidase n=1 Tax=Dyadobacter sp. CY345 TaxID=2909335 RepID=UPI001F45CCD6|nr:S41 family peptidase [Dyadobacter sp. CY345]MCF2447276.1 S41 family peptidase [Dyadobacter sp. CY345]